MRAVRAGLCRSGCPAAASNICAILTAKKRLGSMPADWRQGGRLRVLAHHMALSLARASERVARTDEKHPPMRWIRGRYGTVEIQKSAMRAAPGAGIAGGVWTHTKGCGCRPNRADQAIAIPENAAISATKYWARNTLAIAVPAAWQNASA